MTAAEIQNLVDELEAEINNGGFDQYFFNSAGDKAAEAINALEAIGANKQPLSFGSMREVCWKDAAFGPIPQAGGT